MAVDGDMLSEQDFLAAVEKLVAMLEKRMNSDKKDLDASMLAIAEKFTQLRAEINAATQQSQGKLSDSEKAFYARCEAKMGQMEAQMQAKMAELKDGKDADESLMIAEMLEHMKGMHDEMLTEIEQKLPQLGTAIRDGLEVLPDGEKLAIEAIQDLRKELDELKKIRMVGGVGGGGGFSVSHWPLHEVFTMNGSDTAVTLQQAPGGGGTFIFGVRWQGQMLNVTDEYTVSGNVVTLVGITPSSGDKISVSYIP